ncbi:Aste57867_3065 [Aphanomyces stellatus]|uniref:Aste57867_3065 protein n=1 Tax=Aphanomyces stellatus TaxID=120398 RepID=A0A485KD88_9STRA|nr:hypothetical protein As57867_003056 [Aphanomyces stellatus]VFT80245.1 Aste57867_3065 [Aphanomyces stellatus]
MCERDFQPPPRRARRAFLQLLQRRLNPDQKAKLDSSVTAAELADAISTMAPNRAPGMDGFPAAFYQLDPNHFGSILSIVFKYKFECGQLLGMQRRSAVTLLFKGGDRRNPSNYRPISLIPVEVKAVSRVLCYKMRDILPTLVHPIQTGFVAGQRIHDHVIFLRDLQHKCTLDDEDAFAMFLDFEKAYDRINWEFMHNTLDAFNFGPNFIGWIEGKFYNSFLRWGLRARTQTGRRLLVNTMILSQLCHFTHVLVVPPERLAKWQSMVFKCIVGRKLRREERQVSIVHQVVAYHPTLGLKVPHIPSVFRYQRVQRLNYSCNRTV